MSSITPASFIFLVSFKSDSLGLRLPEGWLCAATIPDAFAFMAAWNSTLRSVTVPEIPPLDSCSRPNTALALLRSNILNSSTYSRLSWSQVSLNSLNASVELFLHPPRRFYFGFINKVHFAILLMDYGLVLQCI